ncbi:DUF6265 family protein [Phenylobacterium sp.]|uniref:DUF6265 family protein n=1 Tax=Phenylobacterium sp. TaxID=1871053 RepID=UPI00286B0507|nr:DUF6265 family protein [Phenylobacterium sp.]
MRNMLIAAALLAAGAAQAAPADVDRLAWMAGSWMQEKGAVVTRETWIAPLGGTMAGITQTNRPGRKPQVEFTTITDEPAGVTFTARVDNQPPTPFVLKPGGEGEAVFENLAHDFPQRVIYRRCGEDLCARIEGTVSGSLKGQDWRYVRAK